jgi:F420-dependent oxidoreductase-like protein
MQFGIFIPQGWRLDLAGIETKDQWRVMRELAQAADRGPWTSLWVYDHFHTVPIATEEATHEAWSLMSAFGAVTERVRLGQMCTCMGYRNPAYLAKVAATADIVSGGRVEMGIGGGWYEHEWNAYGYGFPGAGERLGMLDEGVQIMRDLWTKGTSTLVGKHYQVDGAICRPLPLQDGGIPFWIAGGGEKKTLRTAAKYAQYTNFAGDPETFKRKSEVLAQHCKDVGTEFDAITRSSNFNVVIGDSEEAVEDKFSWIEQHLKPLVPAEEFDRTMTMLRSGPLVGTPEQVVEKLTAAQDLGMTYAICFFIDAAYDRSSIELFESQVIPALNG